MTKLKLFVCTREEGGWKGALLILEESKDKAIDIFKRHEGCIQYKIREINLEEKGIIYDDYER